jgi:hypothetical protein
MKFASVFVGNVRNIKYKLRDSTFQWNLLLWCRLQWDCLERLDDLNRRQRRFEDGVMSTTLIHPSF